MDQFLDISCTKSKSKRNNVNVSIFIKDIDFVVKDFPAEKTPSLLTLPENSTKHLRKK